MNEVLKEILAHFPSTTGQLDRTALGKDVIRIETARHGQVDRIGQFALRRWPEKVYTYSVYRDFRKAHLSIFFK